jgi:transcriptional regulator with XRE-family HTH domain
MQTIGERLEEARKRKGISIREAAEATKIRGDYLHKFESNQFEIKLPDIYIRGFLRIYASYLKLPPEKINADYLALGLGEGGRPAGRGLNREIYGKMEIGHATAGGVSSTKTPGPGNASSVAAPPPETDAPPPSAQRAPFQPRMPLGGLDRALLSKNGLWIGIGAVVLLALVAWGVITIVGSDSTSPAPTPAPAAVAPEPVYIVALRPVQVTAVKSKTDGRDLAPTGMPATLVAGQRYPLPNVGTLVSISARDAVQIEFKGGRYAASGTGPGTLDLPEFGAQR